jgi:hypothetical protein
MYTRKHHKEGSSVRGSIPRWKETFSINEKGGEIHQMQRIEAWFQREIWSQRCRGQRHVLRGSMSDMIFNIASECFHQCQRGRLLIKVGCH